MTPVREVIQAKILRSLRGDALTAMRLYAGFLKGAREPSMAVTYLLELAEHLQHLCRHYMVVESITADVEREQARQQAADAAHAVTVRKQFAATPSAREHCHEPDSEGTKRGR